MTYAWETKTDRAANEAKGNAALYSFYKAIASPSVPFNDFVVQVKTWTPSFFYYFGQSVGLYEKSGAVPVSELMKQLGIKAKMLPTKATDLNDFFDALKKPLTDISLTNWTSIKQVSKYIKEGVEQSVKQATSFFKFGIVPVVLVVGGLWVYMKFFRK
jgi:hypothetical protein